MPAVVAGLVLSLLAFVPSPSASAAPLLLSQGKVDEIFRKQESAQFGTGRYALMFKPGTYHNINAHRLLNLDRRARPQAGRHHLQR